MNNNFKLDNILIYEPMDTQPFYPFSIMHPIWELRVGAFKIYERFLNYFPETNLSFYGRKEHKQAFFAKNNLIETGLRSGNLLVMDSRYILETNLFEQLSKLLTKKVQNSFILQYKNENFGIFLNESDFSRSEEFQRPELLVQQHLEIFNKLPKIEFENLFKLNYLYDILDYVGDLINEDYEYIEENYPPTFVLGDEGVFILSYDKIWRERETNVMPGVVIDSTNGAVIIDKSAVVMPQVTIIGPVYIGKHTIVKVGAKIYPNTAIGDYCKVGGEIEDSVIQDFSNKQHEGFLGHSFLGEWVNLGADTNTSDLKNTYSSIKIRIEKTEIDTGRIFLGLLCGDHTKSGINTMFTTGSVAGICGILVNEWFLPNFIPSFSWGGGKNAPIYKVEKAIETAKIVMKRRNKELLPEQELLIKMEYERIKSMR